MLLTGLLMFGAFGLSAVLFKLAVKQAERMDQLFREEEEEQ